MSLRESESADRPVLEDDLRELEDLAESVFRAHSAKVLTQSVDRVEFDDELWDDLVQTGLALLAVPEDRGGQGAGPREVAAVTRRAVRAGVAAPVGESDLLGGWLMTLASLDPPRGPVAVAPSRLLRAQEDRVRACGVPWARAAEVIVALAGPEAGDHVFVAPVRECVITRSANIAGLPQDEVVFEAAAHRRHDIGATVADELLLRGAWIRCVQTVGALERALELSVEHVNERVQFGRPLAKFQAVQHQIAQAVGEVALARAAVDSAVDTVAVHGFSHPGADLAIAVAKVRSAAAARIVGRAAHHLHGAIGCTLDHSLRHFTMRARAWAFDYGSERYWAERVGRTCVSCPPGELWQQIVADGQVAHV